MWAFFNQWAPKAKEQLDALGVDVTYEEVAAEEQEKKHPVMTLVDRQDGSAGGELEYSFSLNEAQPAAQKFAKPNDSEVALRVTFRWYNGIVSPRAVTTLSWADIEAKALGKAEDSMTKPDLYVPLMPHVPGKGTFSLVEGTDLARVSIELLGGDEKYWRAAQPTISSGDLRTPGQQGKISQVQGHLSRWLVMYTFRPSTAAPGAKITFELKLKKAPYSGKVVAESTHDALTYETSAPEPWKKPSAPSDAAIVELEPLQTGLPIEFETRMISAATLMEIGLKDRHRQDHLIVQYGSPAKTNTRGPKRSAGLVGTDGVFRATISFQDLPEFASGGVLDLEVRLLGSTTPPLGRLKVTLPKPELPDQVEGDQSRGPTRPEIVP